MSTRSIIGTPQDGKFEGRYAHWDGYPSAKVPQLLETYRELGSWESVRDYAVKPDEIGSWSSYMAPSEAAKNDALPTKVMCSRCNGSGREGESIGIGYPRSKCTSCSGSGRAHNFDRTEHWRAGSGDDGLVSSSDDVGAEWAYLLDARGITVVAFLRHDGSKAVGMFGSIGDGYWDVTGRVAWDTDPETFDATPIECGFEFERCIHYADTHFPDAPARISTEVWLGRRQPNYHDIQRVVSLDHGVPATYELTGSGGTGTAQSGDPGVWRTMGPQTPRYWWAEARNVSTGDVERLRVFRQLKAGFRLEPRFIGMVTTAAGDIQIKAGTVLT